MKIEDCPVSRKIQVKMKVLVQLKYLSLRPSLKMQMQNGHGNISVITRQMFVVKVSYILGEIIGGTWSAAQGIWEVVGQLCSANGTGEEQAAGEICKYLEN